jgi:hypothetical protein
MNNEFTCEQLMALYERARAHQDIKLLELIGKEMERRMTPEEPSAKTVETTFIDSEHSRYAQDCKVNAPAGWHIFKKGREIRWTDGQMIQFAEYASTTTHPDKSFDFVDWEKQHANH